jgi:voltage-gated potassium channel
MSLRARVARSLDPELSPGRALSWANRLLVLAIVVAGLLAICETEPTLVTGRVQWFAIGELAFGLLFAIEYLLRVWVAPENPRWGAGDWRARLRYMISPAALIDIVAILPTLFMAAGTSPILLRFFRAIRILRLAKLGRMSDAWEDLSSALHERRHELALTLMIAVCLMLLSSTLLWWAEGSVQPKAFGSIPRALWWSIITLTTIGYGDTFPITALGRFFAGLTAIAGVGLVAMPTGILAAAFSDTVQTRRERLKREQQAARDMGGSTKKTRATAAAKRIRKRESEGDESNIPLPGTGFKS